MKRSNPDQPPFLSWSLICRGRFDHDAELLEGCLKSLRARSPNAEIVIVDTMSPHAGFVEVAQRYADIWDQWRGPKGEWTTDMHAFDDAAAARQRSFELAHGIWRGYIDHDEELVGPDTATRLLKLNAQFMPMVQREEFLRNGPAAAKIVGSTTESFTLEDYIKKIMEAAPDTGYFTAPCLYRIQVDGDFAKKVAKLKAMPPPDEWPEGVGIANTWENAKTKIVKWGDVPSGPKTKWCWREAGHEVLVPRDAHWKERLVHLSRLLYVHRKMFSAEEDRYSMERHFNILYNNYLKGERSSRNLLYLANFSLQLCPQMEAVFLADAHRAAVLPMERTRALVELGSYATRSGLYHDAREAYGGAVQFRGDLPDPWLAGAAAATYFEDWAWAVDWYMEAMKREVGPDSLISPRDHALRTPTLCASVLLRVAREQIQRGLHTQAEANLATAFNLVDSARRHPAVGPDFSEMSAHAACVEQELNAQRSAISLYNLWRTLINNDETEKAASLVPLAPYLLEDHPLMLEMEAWAEPIKKHLTDIKAYRTHYHDELGAVATVEEGYKGHLVRIWDAIQWLKAHHPNGDIFELGPFDGMVGVPVLKALPGCHYTAVDASQKPIDRFHEAAKRHVPDGDARLKTYIGTEATLAKMLGPDDKPIKQFDAVIFMEVIEHVQKTVEALKNVVSLCKPGGSVIVSTPWGAYDRGHPANTATGEPRDHRGHVRAITPRQMATWMKAAGITPIELYRVDGEFGIGDTMVVFGEPGVASKQPLNIAVRGALWDWHGRSVEGTGIGASEEMIVQLAEHFADNGHPTNVFGPAPEHDIHKKVGYWKQSQLRFAEGDKIIVSRAPSWAPEVDKLARRKMKKILWLQDAHYGDLNEKSAADYEKIVVVSNWHKEAMHEQHGVPLEQMEVIYNWLLPEHFERCDGDKDIEREPHHFIYASSPDRGLITLLRLWPDILKVYDDATLDIFYGWKGCVKLGQGDAAWIKRFIGVREEYNRLRWQKGVTERGMVPHRQIAREFMRAAALPYPTLFLETCCTNALKARAAGCVIVTSPLAGLNETAACPQTQWVDPEGLDTLTDDYRKRFIDALVAAVETPERERQAMSELAIRQHCFEQRLPTWLKLLEGK